MRIAILLPVKDTSRAKQRLAAVHSQEERTALARAMMENVFAAVAEFEREAQRGVARTDASESAPRVFVVSSDAHALDAARARGWETLREETQVSESASVDWASREVAARGFDAALRLPCDIPLLRGSDVAEIIRAAELATARATELGATQAAGRAPAAADGSGRKLCVLVPSRDGTGTNALLRMPADLLPSHFGPDSFAKHLREAEVRGAEVRVVRNERIGLDIDDADDLAAARAAEKVAGSGLWAKAKVEARR